MLVNTQSVSVLHLSNFSNKKNIFQPIAEGRDLPLQSFSTRLCFVCTDQNNYIGVSQSSSGNGFKCHPVARSLFTLRSFLCSCTRLGFLSQQRERFDFMSVTDSYLMNLNDFFFFFSPPPPSSSLHLSSRNMCVFTMAAHRLRKPSHCSLSKKNIYKYILILH